MPTITTKDGTQIYYKDWGKGQPVIFSHGWPLSADAWDDQMIVLAARGYRCIAHDRRGHGRSGQPWEGNDMDTLPTIWPNWLQRSIFATQCISGAPRVGEKWRVTSGATEVSGLPKRC